MPPSYRIFSGRYDLKPSDLERALRIHEVLEGIYPETVPLLSYANAYQLLIGVILSAQTTDRQVNSVTPGLFERFPDASSLAKAPIPEVERIIRPVGFFHVKAANIVGTAGALMERHGGEVPSTIEDLVRLPGVGRKSANVIMGNWFGKPAIIVDTHFMRVTSRLGFVDSGDPVDIEREFLALLPPGVRTGFSMRINYHGRSCCTARKPSCSRCPIRAWCRWYSALP